LKCRPIRSYGYGGHAPNQPSIARFHFTLTFESYTPEEIVAIARHIAGKEKIAIADAAWPLLAGEALRLRSLPTDPTTLDVAGTDAARAQGGYRLQTNEPATVCVELPSWQRTRCWWSTRRHGAGVSVRAGVRAAC
jgi:hypothetical protein